MNRRRQSIQDIVTSRMSQYLMIDNKLYMGTFAPNLLSTITNFRFLWGQMNCHFPFTIFLWLSGKVFIFGLLQIKGSFHIVFLHIFGTSFISITGSFAKTKLPLTFYFISQTRKNMSSFQLYVWSSITYVIWRWVAIRRKTRNSNSGRFFHFLIASEKKHTQWSVCKPK